MHHLHNFKKYILFWALVVVSTASKAQNIPNFDFSTWVKTSSSFLNNWNYQGIVAKDSIDPNNLGVTLFNDTSGLTSLYQIGRRFPDYYNGGFPINGTPNNLKISYRTDNLLSDTALVIFGCTRGTDTMPIVLQQFYLFPGQGNSSNQAIANFALPYSHPVAALSADSAFIIIYSSLRNKKPNASGSISISNIELSNAQGTFQDNSNLQLNEWYKATIEHPQNWTTSHVSYYNNRKDNQAISLTSKFFDGTKNVLELKAQPLSVNNIKDTIAAWALTNNLQNPNPTIDKPAFSFTGKPGAMQINWTGFLSNDDRFTVTVNFFRGDTIIGSGTFSKSASNYNHSGAIPTIENIEWLPNYTEMPESASAMLWLTDSSFSKQSTTSSFVRISKITFLPFGLNIKKKYSRNQLLTIYPNPVADKLIVNSTESIKRIQLINSIGHVVWEGTPLEDNSIHIPEGLAAGNYWMSIALTSGTVTKYLQIIR
jgi:hypothetical protein